MASAPQTSGLLDKLSVMADDQSNAPGRESALMAFSALCDHVGSPMEPFAVPMLPVFLERLADKVSRARHGRRGATLRHGRVCRAAGGAPAWLAVGLQQSPARQPQLPPGLHAQP